MKEAIVSLTCNRLFWKRNHLNLKIFAIIDKNFAIFKQYNEYGKNVNNILYEFPVTW